MMKRGAWPKGTCSACGDRKVGVSAHPLLGSSVHTCLACIQMYQTGDFEIQDGHEIYCRWCGTCRGEELLQCDFCAKSWCDACVKRNRRAQFDQILDDAEKGKFKCFAHGPITEYAPSSSNRSQLEPAEATPLQLSNIITPELAPQKNPPRKKQKVSSGKGDLSLGREPLAICVSNTLDAETVPNFKYITSNGFLENDLPVRNIHTLACCLCDRHDGVCEDSCCHISEGSDNLPVSTTQKAPVFIECNYKCLCLIDCPRRQIQRKRNVDIEVFRAQPHGLSPRWSVRVREDVSAGSFLGEYVGEYSQNLGRNPYSYRFPRATSKTLPEDAMEGLDASRYGNFTRFLRMSRLMSEVNTETRLIWFDHNDLRFPRIGFFAKQELDPLEELIILDPSIYQ